MAPWRSRSGCPTLLSPRLKSRPGGAWESLAAPWRGWPGGLQSIDLYVSRALLLGPARHRHHQDGGRPRRHRAAPSHSAKSCPGSPRNGTTASAPGGIGSPRSPPRPTPWQRRRALPAPAAPHRNPRPPAGILAGMGGRVRERVRGDGPLAGKLPRPDPGSSVSNELEARDPREVLRIPGDERSRIHQSGCRDQQVHGRDPLTRPLQGGQGTGVDRRES